MQIAMWIGIGSFGTLVAIIGSVFWFGREPKHTCPKCEYWRKVRATRCQTNSPVG